VDWESVADLSLTHISSCITFAGVSQAFGTINKIYAAFALG